MIDAIVDLSHWQSGPRGAAIDFRAVRASGVAAVILKATQGSSWTDSTFVERRAAAETVGLWVGAYHFADASDPAAQAAHFLSLAGEVPRLAVDIEANAISNDSVSVEQAAELVARIHQASGKLPAVYMGRWGPDGSGSGLPNSVLARCPLWLPEYGNNPLPPAGWDSWTIWQYTAAGTVAGIAGSCDRNRFNGTADDLAVWWTQ